MGRNRDKGALRLFTLAAMLLVVICCAQICSAYSPGDPEFRGFWVDAWHSGILRQSQVDTLLGVPGDPDSKGQVRDANCNAVVIQIRRNADAAYPSQMGEPYMSGLSPADFNGLQAAINAAHDTTGGKQRIEVHAWMVTFRTSGGAVYQAHDDTPTGSLTTLDNYWPSRDVNGNEVSDKGFDPGHPLAEDYIVNVAMDIVNNFDVDGIHFDYIRFTANNQGYNPTSIARYNARYGLTGQPSATNEQFKQWRRDQVSAVVRKVYAKTQASKPSVRVSGSFVTWNPSPTSSTRDGFKGTRPYYDVYSDWDSWLQEGIVDAAIPMTYYNWASLPNDYTRWINWEKDRHSNRHMYIGPGIYMNSLSNSVFELQKTREASPAGNYADGFCGYSYFAPYTNGGTNYGNWAGFVPTFTAQVATTPAPIPDMPWKTSPTKGHISGTVTVRTTGAWADGTTVTISGPESRSMLCDGTGFYAFIDLTPGTYTVTASMTGLPSSTRTADVAIGSVTGNMYVTDFVLGGPIMSSIVASPLSTTSEAITWNTDQGSTSRVEYGLTASYGSITTLNPTLVTTHSVVVTGLTPKTVYHYRVISSNVDGTTVSDDQTFTSIGPPEITGVGIATLTNYGGTVVWTTDQPATTQVQYGPTTAYGSTTTLNSALVTSHSQALISMPPLTLYHYRVISSNVNGTTTSGDYTFSTSGVPVISTASIVVSNITASTATISWTTNAPSNTTVNYGLTTSYGGTATNAASVTSHTITLTGLTPVKTYHFRCNSINPYGSSTTGDLTFTTIAAPTVTGVQITGITATSATMTWTSDQPTEGAVSYGYTTAYGMQTSDPALVTSHSITLTGLTSATPYRYKCLSTNATGTGSSPDYTFTTLLGPNDTVIDDSDAACTRTGTWLSSTGGYKNTNKNQTNRLGSPTVTCTWTPTLAAGYYDIYVYYPLVTNATTNASFIVHGNGDNVIAPVNETSGGYQWNLVASHVAFLAGTGGYVRLTNTTGETSLTTYVVADAVKFVYTGIVGPPVITNVAAATSSTSATVTWNTDQNSTSQVEYGLTTSYGSTVTEATQIAAHSLALTGLAPNTTYHYMVTSTNPYGTTTSDDYTMRTPAFLMIVDDANEAAMAYTGGWTVGSFNPTTAYNSTYRFASTNGLEAPTATATFVPDIPIAGAYDVYCHYNSGGNRSTEAKYTISTAGGPVTAMIDQTRTGSQWVLLGAGLQLDPGSGNVRLDNSGPAGVVVIADAIKWTTAGIVNDVIRPSVAIGSPSTTLTRFGPVSYSIDYDDDTVVSAVTLTSADVTLNRSGTADGTVTVTGSGMTSRTVTISNITGSGTLGISIAANTATDAAANQTLAAGPSATFDVDSAPPTIAIGNPSTTLTSGGPVTYTVTYDSAAAVNLTSGDITLEKVGTANGTVSVTGAGNTTRTVTVSNITGDGELAISIAAVTAIDIMGNVALATGPSASFSVDNSTVPSAAISEPSANTTSGDPITYTINYDSADTVTLSAAHITLNKTGTANGTVSVTGSGNATRTVTINGFTGSGTICISIAAGSASTATGTLAPAAGPSATFAVALGAPPTVSIGAPSAAMTSSGPVSYTITYGNAEDITLSAANITLNKTGTANGTVAVTGSGDTARTVTILSITGNGALGVSIAAGTAGGSAPAAGPSATFVADNTAPVMTENDPSGGYTDNPTKLCAQWYAFDNESWISRYECAVGTSPTAIDDVKNWTSMGSSEGGCVTGLSLTVGHTYYLSLRAVNGVGLVSPPMTSPITICYIANSVRELKALPLGAAVHLMNSPACNITTAFPDPIHNDSYCYVEDHTRAAGIRLDYNWQSSEYVAPNRTLNAWGVLGLTDNGERRLTSVSFAVGVDPDPAILPLAATAKSLGGGVLGNSPGVTSGVGLNNIGLLVRVAGHVTKGVADGFYLDDGSKLTDDTGYAGIKVWTGVSGVSRESTNVMVTGPVSCRKVGAVVYPQILARDITTP